MSWSPNPLDYDFRQGSPSNYKKQIKLPSQQIHHGGSGASYLAKESKKKRKVTQKRKDSAEIIDMAPMGASNTRAEALHPTGRAQDISSSSTVGTNDTAYFGDVDDFTYKDLDALKELNCTMARKKEIRAKLIADQGKKAGGSAWKSDLLVAWRRFKENSTDAVNNARLWESSLHEIEGRFGTGIRSYFAFLRWLFLLNLFIFFLVFIFVVVPAIAFDNLRGSAIVSTIAAERNISAECAYNPFDPNAINSFRQYMIWWFTGQGFMENTLLFCGYYDNAATVIQTSGFYFYYNIPLAYLLVAFFYFFISLVLIVRRAAYGFHETQDDRFYLYCNRVFSGWDYCINDARAAHLKHRNIKHELEVDIEEDKIKERQANRTRNEKLVLYSKRFLVNLVVITILVASLVAIFFAAQYALQNNSTFDNDFFLDLLVTYLVSIVITAANFVAPVLFGFLVKYEDYSPEFTIRFTLIRTVVLRLASVVFLYVVVYIQIHCSRYQNIVDTAFDATCSHCVGVECWETYLGQEMYKLTLLDFFIVIAVTLFVEFPRKLVVDFCNCASWIGYQEFVIPSNVLDIIYGQTVAWIGAFYAPLLPVMVVIKFFVFFHLKKLTLLYNCRPASRPYRASRSGTFFFTILLFGFAVAVFPVAISVSIITPSIDCGPFRSWPSMFYALTASVLTLPTWAREMFFFFGSAGFAAVIIVILCVILYYFYASRSAQKKTIRLLKNQLLLEGKDKQFLLKRVTEIGDNYEPGGNPRKTSVGHLNANKSRYNDDDLPGQANDIE